MSHARYALCTAVGYCEHWNICEAVNVAAQRRAANYMGIVGQASAQRANAESMPGHAMNGFDQT